MDKNYETQEKQVENVDYVICKVCGEKVGRVYGKHLKGHRMTSKEYKEKFPNAPLTTKKDQKNTTKNGGKHMKQEKYKKMFSEKIKGKKNPNHKSKTTEEERKQRSPFSKEFYKKDGLTEQEIEKRLSEFREEATKNISYNTRIDYYLDKGYSEDEAKEMLKERQRTFTLEKCIQKYGKEKGEKIFTERQKRWQKSLYENGNLKFGFSKISQELFYEIMKSYKYEGMKDVYFATKNEEIKIKRTDKGGIWIYDFTDKKRKKIIEYNGDEYHANPKMFEANDRPHPFRKGNTAKQIWKKDKMKIDVAKNEGYDVLVIWDSEYRKNKQETIDKCVNFLFN